MISDRKSSYVMIVASELLLEYWLWALEF